MDDCPDCKTAVAVAALLMPCRGYAQDVPGIEICTVEKTMERRTCCLQSNVDFLVKTINKITTIISRSSTPPTARSKA